MLSMDDELKKIGEGKTDAKTAQAVFAVVLSQVRVDISSVKTSLEKEYATNADIRALDTRVRILEKLVYGAVGIILLSVFGALIALVVRK